MKNIIYTSIFLLFFATTLKSQVRIKMQKEGGVYTTPCFVNGLRLRFIFDTGASSVSMSLSEAIFMLKNGYLDETDLHGSSFSQIANGDIVENTTVNLKDLEIGGIKIHNVEATIIHELSAPLLLGQSAIQKLGKIQIEDDELLIMSFKSLSNDDIRIEARTLVDKAKKHYFEELFALSADIFQKAYDLSPDVLDCFELGLMGSSYYKSDNFLSAIKYYEKASDCEKDIRSLHFIYGYLAESYFETNNYDKSILFIQKALSLAKENNDISYCYFRLGYIYNNQKKFNQAVDSYEKSIEYYLKHLSSTVNEVMKGKIKNDTLGETYFNISHNYYKIGQKTKSDSYMIKSALCGYVDAINFCKKYDIKYELYIE